MKLKIFIMAATILFFCCFSQLIAQPFANEIRKFKKQDSTSFPAPKGILLIGSSSFTKWTDVQEYFPKKRIINRGFGGSTLVDVIRYADDIIFPYQPKQVVIYCGENDLAASDTVTAAIVVDRFKQLFHMIRSKMPKVSVVFISLKPSPSRRKHFEKAIAANKSIKEFLSTRRATHFVDVFNPMLIDGKEPNGSLFLSDSLHMNAKGYQLWKGILEPYLAKTK